MSYTRIRKTRPVSARLFHPVVAEAVRLRTNVSSFALFAYKLSVFRRELAAHHLSVPVGFILHGLPTVESGMDCVRALLQGDDAPDAVICSDDRLALGALRAAHQLGLRVPEQFGIISCDNTPLTELAETPITSVDVDTFALGVQAAQILIEQIEDPQTSLRQILLSTKLIERASTMRETQEETEAIHI